MGCSFSMPPVENFTYAPRSNISVSNVGNGVDGVEHESQQHIELEAGSTADGDTFTREDRFSVTTSRTTTPTHASEPPPIITQGQPLFQAVVPQYYYSPTATAMTVPTPMYYTNPALTQVVHLPTLASVTRSGERLNFSTISLLKDVLRAVLVGRVNVTFALDATVLCDAFNRHNTCFDKLSLHSLKRTNPFRSAMQMIDSFLTETGIERTYNLLTFGSSMTANSSRLPGIYNEDVHPIAVSKATYDEVESVYVNWSVSLGHEDRVGRVVDMHLVEATPKNGGKHLTLSGPTTFAGVTKWTHEHSPEDEVSLLFILSCGVPNDGSTCELTCTTVADSSVHMSPSEVELRKSMNRKIVTMIIGIGDGDTPIDVRPTRSVSFALPRDGDVATLSPTNSATPPPTSPAEIIQNRWSKMIQFVDNIGACQSSDEITRVHSSSLLNFSPRDIVEFSSFYEYTVFPTFANRDLFLMNTLSCVAPFLTELEVVSRQGESVVM